MFVTIRSRIAKVEYTYTHICVCLLFSTYLSLALSLSLSLSIYIYIYICASECICMFIIDLLVLGFVLPHIFYKFAGISNTLYIQRFK